MAVCMDNEDAHTTAYIYIYTYIYVRMHIMHIYMCRLMYAHADMCAHTDVSSLSLSPYQCIMYVYSMRVCIYIYIYLFHIYFIYI